MFKKKKYTVSSHPDSSYISKDLAAFVAKEGKYFLDQICKNKFMIPVEHKLF